MVGYLGCSEQQQSQRPCQQVFQCWKLYCHYSQGKHETRSTAVQELLEVGTPLFHAEFKVPGV